MKLTTAQITYIDDYLKHHKVKYWDIRIELLDHIVSNVEDKMTQGLSFDDAMIEVHKSFGNSMKMLWNTHTEYSIFVNGEGYKDLIQVKIEQLNKMYRNLYFKEFINLFTSFKSLSVIILIVFIEYVAFNSVSNLIFKRINLTVFFIPLIIILVLFTIQYFKKNKSIHLEYASFYAMSSFLILNVFVQARHFSIYEKLVIDKNILFSVLSILNLLLCYGGIKMYLSSIKKYNDLHKKLQSL